MRGAEARPCSVMQPSVKLRKDWISLPVPVQKGLGRGYSRMQASSPEKSIFWEKPMPFGRRFRPIFGRKTPFFHLKLPLCVLTYRRHPTCKTLENFVSLGREKGGYAPCAYPLFCIADYQCVTRLGYVHVAPLGCTCRKNSKYSRQNSKYPRQDKLPFSRSQKRLCRSWKRCAT